MNWYLKVWKQYADFSGRARRTEYWMFVLFNVIFTIAGAILGLLIGGIAGYAAIVGLYALAIIIPSLAVAVRRLHDLNKSGWNILLGLIPLVGGIILLVFYCTEGTPGDNNWGPNPKEEAIV
jgi:uncharacterized membrane protein YhaH (DUF805 family)